MRKRYKLRQSFTVLISMTFSQSSKRYQAEVADLKNQIKDLTKVKENSLREISELKLQLKMVEEARDGVRRELIDAHRKIRDGEEAREVSRKENIDLKRQLKDEEREKEAVQQTANELRGKVITVILDSLVSINMRTFLHH